MKRKLGMGIFSFNTDILDAIDNFGAEKNRPFKRPVLYIFKNSIYILIFDVKALLINNPFPCHPYRPAYRRGRHNRMICLRVYRQPLLRS